MYPEYNRNPCRFLYSTPKAVIHNPAQNADYSIMPDPSISSLRQSHSRFDDSSNRENTWRPLQWLNYYRLLVGLVLLVYLLLAGKSAYIGFEAPRLTTAVTLVYLLFSAASALSTAINWPRFSIQVHSHIVADISFITLIMHFSGGIVSGYGMLLNIAIAGGALIVGGRTAILFASLAAIAILSEQFYSHLSGTTEVNYPQAGILGVSYFTTAILAHVLANRIRESESLARQRGSDLARMAALNEHVIRQLETGIIVIDAGGMIQLANQAAEKALQHPRPLRGTALADISPFLFHQYQLWRGNSHYHPASLMTDEGRELRPQFTGLGFGDEAGTLVHIEDLSAMIRHAQQLKLASLGRLTASIAHEIRNPLGAISHASQLLRESEHLPEADIRLTQIINTHTQRVNEIVENILQIGKRGRHIPETFDIHPWLRSLLDEYLREHDLGPEDIRLADTAAPVLVSVDKSQIRQVIINLIDNGLRHASRQAARPLVELRFSDTGAAAPSVQVCDNGPGIDDSAASHIFEPFFTTQSSGTGLGLYICKELCDINSARIDYSNRDGPSRFTIHFSKPDMSRQ